MKQPATVKINDLALRLLEATPDGLRWKALVSRILETDTSLHPKTVNGCVWKLVEKYPNKVHKPEKGVFQLIKFSKSKT